jgi:hypothetical protein
MRCSTAIEPDPHREPALGAMRCANQTAGRDRKLFLGALWLALATALLFAIAPSGLPGSEAKGSAFSPSNSAVALRARATQTSLVTKRVATRDDVDPQAHVVTRLDWHSLVPGVATLLAADCVDDRPFVTTPSRGPLLSALLRMMYPRGPPVA